MENRNLSSRSVFFWLARILLPSRLRSMYSHKHPTLSAWHVHVSSPMELSLAAPFGLRLFPLMWYAFHFLSEYKKINKKHANGRLIRMIMEPVSVSVDTIVSRSMPFPMLLFLFRFEQKLTKTIAMSYFWWRTSASFNVMLRDFDNALLRTYTNKTSFFKC